jgi:hypothetical protein
LYVSGFFTRDSYGTVLSRIAKWNGTSWSPLGPGLQEYGALSLVSFDDGGGAELWVGGYFHVSPAGDSYVARWSCPPTATSTTYCTAGTTTNGCVPHLASAGIASASMGSSFTLIATSVEGGKAGLFFYGMSGANGAAWSPASTSFLCVKAPTQRTATLNSGGAVSSCDGVLSIDWNAYIASHPSALGQPFAGGETVWAQAWFRDPPAPKTTNLSDGLVFVVGP